MRVRGPVMWSEQSLGYWIKWKARERVETFIEWVLDIVERILIKAGVIKTEGEADGDGRGTDSG